jgi:hypothetical protein
MAAPGAIVAAIHAQAGVARQSSEILSFVIPLLLLAWLGIQFCAAAISGWRKLAQVYRANGPFSGRRWRLQSAELRWRIGYNNCLTLGSGAEGLFLSVLLPFRFSHPPLLIPWTDIASRDVTRWRFFRMTEVRTRLVSDVPIVLHRRVVERLRSAPGARWPADAAAGPQYGTGTV